MQNHAKLSEKTSVTCWLGKQRSSTCGHLLPAHVTRKHTHTPHTAPHTAQAQHTNTRTTHVWEHLYSAPHRMGGAVTWGALPMSLLFCVLEYQHAMCVMVVCVYFRRLHVSISWRRHIRLFLDMSEQQNKMHRT